MRAAPILRSARPVAGSRGLAAGHADRRHRVGQPVKISAQLASVSALLDAEPVSIRLNGTTADLSLTAVTEMAAPTELSSTVWRVTADSADISRLIAALGSDAVLPQPLAATADLQFLNGSLTANGLQAKLGDDEVTGTLTVTPHAQSSHRDL